MADPFCVEGLRPTRTGDEAPALGIELWAVRLFPLRFQLLWLALGAFTVGATPLLCVAYLGVAPEAWFGPILGASVPVVFWSWALALIATWFHPSEGTIGAGSPWFVAQPAWMQRFLRRYAIATVAGFAVSPAIVYLAI